MSVSLKRVHRRRRAVAAASAFVVLAIGAGVSAGQDAAPSVTAEPTLGLPATDVQMVGAAVGGEAGEVWAYGKVADSGQLPLVDGQPVKVGTSGFVVLRRTAAAGWRVRQGALGEDGAVLDTFEAAEGPGAGHVTARGGVVLLGDVRTDAGNTDAVLLHDPGTGPFRRLPAPRSDDPDDPDDDADAVLRAGESLQSNGRFAITAIDGSSGTQLLAAAVGPARETGVLRYDGEAWTREEVEAPAQGSFRIVAIDATSLDQAWLLARIPNRGIVLYAREDRAGRGVWVERSLGDSLFAKTSDADTGAGAIGPTDYPTQPLTALDGGVWIDGALQAQGRRYSFSLFYSGAERAVKRSFCDAPQTDGSPLCDQGLGGAILPTSPGYRSVAFAGEGLGTRVITNPLTVVNDPTSNRGAYLTYDGTQFARQPGAGNSGNDPAGGAFSAIDEGFLGGQGSSGVIHITRQPEGRRLQRVSLPVRDPLLAIAGEPGKPAGSLDAQAVAVGADGAVVRYIPGSGWRSEPLLGSNGRATPQLRGVAWPEAARTHAVGARGQMWLWRAETGLWETDPAVPDDFQADLTGVAFDPADPYRGYAVGSQGTLLRYDKTWTQEPLPAGYAGSAVFTGVAFAGRQALVAADDQGLLVNDGSGWKVDPQVAGLLGRRGGTITAVAGLPDGSAVAAGLNTVLLRDAGGPWREASTPIPGTTAVAAGAFREDGEVRAVLAVDELPYPGQPPVVVVDPTLPPVLPVPIVTPADGHVLRQTAGGWRDEEHQRFRRSSRDLGVRSDATTALLLDGEGRGWTVGGETGRRTAGGFDVTAAASRYPTASAVPGDAVPAPVPADSSLVSFAIGGHAVCTSACADLAGQSIGPDRGLSVALQRAGEMAAQPGGPRAFLYTGGRLNPSAGALTQAEADRYAAVARSAGSAIPFFPAVSSGEGPNGGAGAFSQAFASFPGPFGEGGSPPGVDTGSTPGATPESGARTHYAFDSTGSGGAIRVVVIDNSAGSLAASDPYQNPREAQEPWLVSVLDDARQQAIPVIVVGSRDLNSGVQPAANVADDADRIARLLVDHGASAYFFDRPRENRQYAIPAGAATTIPSFGTGTLGYGSPPITRQFFGENGLLLAGFDLAKRDAATNRVPVSVRLIPVIEKLAIDAVDGNVLRRSRPALFQALARRPIAGVEEPIGDEPAADPYVPLPPLACIGTNCATRIEPEFAFKSSDPDLGDFVARDSASTNLRAVLLGKDGKAVSDSHSGLFCAFNPGTTTVSVSSGGLSYSAPVTILGGSVDRPCGTRAVDPSRFKAVEASVDTPAQAPAAPQPQAQPDPTSPPPPLPTVAPVAAAPVTPPAPKPKPATPPRFVPTPFSAPPVPSAPSQSPPTAIPPPPGGAVARPIPPSGTSIARVYQVEEKKEEEVAIEESQAASAYDPNHDKVMPEWSYGLIVLLAFASAAGTGASLQSRRRRDAAWARVR